MTRRCAHCRGRFTPKRSHAIYCSDRCRAAAWKGKPHEPAETAGERVPRPGGAQISYRKAVAVVAQALSQYSYLGGEMDGFVTDAENVLRDALPERQRAKITPIHPTTRI